MDLETLLQKYKNASEEEYRLVFLSALDKDQDGVVTSKDLKEVLRELNPGSGISDSDVADMIKMVDSKVPCEMRMLQKECIIILQYLFSLI